jgi:hypothetical protein
MSARGAQLPEWARPRDEERRGLGSLRLAETTILILFGVLLAVATVNDVAQQTHVNHRLIADLHTTTWSSRKTSRATRPGTRCAETSLRERRRSAHRCA